jgi:hypothetical protein
METDSEGKKYTLYESVFSFLWFNLTLNPVIISYSERRIGILSEQACILSVE